VTLPPHALTPRASRRHAPCAARATNSGRLCPRFAYWSWFLPLGDRSDDGLPRVAHHRTAKSSAPGAWVLYRQISLSGGCRGPETPREARASRSTGWPAPDLVTDVLRQRVGPGGPPRPHSELGTQSVTIADSGRRRRSHPSHPEGRMHPSETSAPRSLRHECDLPRAAIQSAIEPFAVDDRAPSGLRDCWSQPVHGHPTIWPGRRH